MNLRKVILFALVLSLSPFWLGAQGPSNPEVPAVDALPENGGDILAAIDKMADEIDEKVIKWRRHIHQYPELPNREFETGAMIAKHLRDLGLEVTDKVAFTGVKGVLRGGKPGPVVALRADIDGLPVTERADVPYASKAKSTLNGQEVGVMHACGHDAHAAMLMGAAEVLASVKDDLPGTVVFIFQPAEEGAPPGEEGGAKVMMEEGVLDDPKVDVVFGQHINSQTEVGKIRYKVGGIMASSDRFDITVQGKQVHGSSPWFGIDPITVAAQIVQGLNNIISRQTNLTKEAAVISVGTINGGVRNNIIPESCTMSGTIRCLDEEMQEIILEKIRTTATNIAESAGAVADVKITRGYPVTDNNLELVRQMVPTFEKVAGEENVIITKANTGSEDFSFFAKAVPGIYFFVGGMKKGMNPAEAPPHHSPDFYLDDSGLKLGVRTLCYLAVEYMQSQ